MLRSYLTGFALLLGLVNVSRGAENWSVQRTVVDPEGKPLPGVKLTCIDYERPEERREVVTDAQGSFRVEFPARTRAAKAQAVDQFHSRWGFGDLYVDRKGRKPKPIVVYPLQEITVEVVDAAGKPLEGATVDIGQANYTVLREKTDKQGKIKTRVAPHTYTQIRALQANVGFDYFVYRPTDKKEPILPWPATVKLKLEGAKTIEVQAIDHQDNPLSGIVFELAQLHRAGNREQGSLVSDDLMRCTTNADGSAIFDWIPRDLLPRVQVICRTEEFEPDLIQIIQVQDSKNLFPIRLWRKTKLSGRVKMPDGSPANETKIRVQGKGPVSTTEEYKTTTGPDGSYELEVRAEQVYAVVAEKGDLVGHQVSVVAHEHQPVKDVVVQLRPGTVVKGQVTQGKDNRPMAKQEMNLLLDGGPIPNELKLPPSLPRPYGVPLYFSWRMPTDANGEYQFVVSSGEYLMSDPLTYQSTKLKVEEEKEVIRNIHIPWEDSALMGSVVDAKGKPVAGARVEGQYVYFGRSRLGSIRLTTDAEGKFKCPRKTIPIRFRILSKDRTLGIVTRSMEEATDQTFKLLPLSTIQGRLLAPNGEPQKQTTLKCHTNLFEEEKSDQYPLSYQWETVSRTDAEGRFKFSELPCGAEWTVQSFSQPLQPQVVGKAYLLEPTQIDLGDVTLK